MGKGKKNSDNFSQNEKLQNEITRVTRSKSKWAEINIKSELTEINIKSKKVGKINSSKNLNSRATQSQFKEENKIEQVVKPVNKQIVKWADF